MEHPKRKYPTLERAVPEINYPPNSPLDSSLLWDSKNENIPNIKVLKDWFFREGKLSKLDIQKICELGSNVLRNEDNILRIEGSVTVCGDIHGQFYDLVSLFEIGGDVESTIYLFLGDYVDRGQFGFECTILLLAHKIVYPNNFFLLRGNHECRNLTEYFNFKEECIYKYDNEIYSEIMMTFDCLPLVAIVNNVFFCCHGGISPEFTTLDNISNIDRFKEPPTSGGMCDLLWADPLDEDSDNFDTNIKFIANTARGCSFFFGPLATQNFLSQNNFLSILRAHEAQSNGYKMHHMRKQTNFPSVITLFSAPNYCDYYANKGAILKYHDNFMNIKQYDFNPHPYYLPSFMDAFTWSLPFVNTKIQNICNVILEILERDEQTTNEKQTINEENDLTKFLNSRRSVLKYKTIAATKFLMWFKILRDKSDEIIKVKQISIHHQLPKGFLRKHIHQDLDNPQKKHIDQDRIPSRQDFEDLKGGLKRQLSSPALPLSHHHKLVRSPSM